MNLALSVASTMGADAGTPAGAAGVGGVGLCMGGLSKQGRGRSKPGDSTGAVSLVRHQQVTGNKDA